MRNSYSFNIKVSKGDIDDLNHVNNVVYLNWVLEAAKQHWELLSNPAQNLLYVWVILRHEIDYLASGMLNDDITITTWVDSSAGVKSDRIVEIKRDNKLLAKAKTTWCLLDKTTMRPVRIPDEILTVLHKN
jgi:acyl-CoA thioester hydrolase